jgi:hypothetical protein
VLIGNPITGEIYANTEQTEIYVHSQGNESSDINIISASGIPNDKLNFKQPIRIRITASGIYEYRGIDTQADAMYSAGANESNTQDPVYLSQIRFGTIQPFSGLQVFVTGAQYGDYYVADTELDAFDGTATDTSMASISPPATNNRKIGVLVQLDAANGV